MATETRSYAGDLVVQENGHPSPEDIRPAGQGVYERLFREGYRFDFFHAVQLLERLFPDAAAPGESSDVREERIRITPSPSLIFPPTDVKRIDLAPRPFEHAHVTATFMGLYGIGSPLPEFVRERIAAENEDTYSLRDFLDIFNHRTYSFFYRSWKKFRPELAQGGASRRDEQGRFLMLAGLGTPRALEGAPVPPKILAALAGRLACRARNAEGLKHLVEQVVGVAAAVVQNIPQWVAIRQRPALGSRGGFRVGDSGVVGARVYDVAGKFRIRLGPMGLTRYLSLLPGGPDSKVLRWLVSLYAPDQLAYDVELQLHTTEIPPLQLGTPVCKLGLTTCLGRPATPVISRIVGYDKASGMKEGVRERGNG